VHEIRAGPLEAELEGGGEEHPRADRRQDQTADGVFVSPSEVGDGGEVTKVSTA
jgi:hypothetical protein